MKFLRYNSSMFVMTVALLFPVAGFAESTAILSDMQRLLVSLKAQLASIQQSASAQSNTTTPLITRSLALGSTGPDVAALQQFLKGKGYFNVEPTGYFGPLTRQAVATLQSANGLEPVGHVGPQTRKLLNGIVGPDASPSISASVDRMFVRTLDIGSRGDDVKTLQGFLRSKGHLNTEPTGYYGMLTNEAIKQFQQANNLEAVGTVGPKTRVLLNSVMSGTAPGQNTAPVVSTKNSFSPVPIVSFSEASSGGGPSAPTPVSIEAPDTVPPSAPASPVQNLDSNGRSSPDTTAPSVPTNLSGTAISSTRINLTWTASTDNVAVVGYKILRDGVQVGTSATNSFSNTGLAASTVYNYTIVAYDVANNSSAQSSASAAITLEVAPLAIAIGGRVTTTAPLNVRSGAGFTIARMGSQPVSAEGIVVAGHVSADGHTWWNINYDTGVDGWSIADYLIAVAPASSPAVGLQYAPLVASAR